MIGRPSSSIFLSLFALFTGQSTIWCFVVCLFSFFLVLFSIGRSSQAPRSVWYGALVFVFLTSAGHRGVLLSLWSCSENFHLWCGLCRWYQGFFLKHPSSIARSLLFSYAVQNPQECKNVVMTIKPINQILVPRAFVFPHCSEF